MFARFWEFVTPVSTKSTQPPLFNQTLGYPLAPPVQTSHTSCPDFYGRPGFTLRDLFPPRSFEELLRRSREEDLSSIEETACLYRAAGYDKQGRAVIVFIGKWFRQSQVSNLIMLRHLYRTTTLLKDRP